MSNVINISKYRPTPEPPVKFRNRIGRFFSNLYYKIRFVHIVGAILAFTLTMAYLEYRNHHQRMGEICKPDHFESDGMAADGLYRITCLSSKGEHRYIYQER